MTNAENKKAAGRPNRSNKDHKAAPSSEKGTAAGYMRKTYLTDIKLTKKFNAIAFWDGKTLKEVLHEAMVNYVITWEEKNGPVNMPSNK